MIKFLRRTVNGASVPSESSFVKRKSKYDNLIWVLLIIGHEHKKNDISYITLLCSLSTRQAPKPSRVNLSTSFSNIYIFF